jgi:hypothetical protein
LGDAQLKALVVGKAFWVRNNVTGDTFSVSYTAEGHANYWHIGKNDVVPSGYGNVFRDGYQGTTVPYKVEGGKVISFVSQDPYWVTVFKLGDTYYGARSNEFGYANYEMIETPLMVINPVAALGNQLAIELSLTEQQKQQITPILKAEMPQLEALKKNTSLKPLDKIDQLKQISGTVDARITPLLNADQQKKFTEIRDEYRRQLIEKMSSKVIQKAETEAKQKM